MRIREKALKKADALKVEGAESGRRERMKI